MVVGMTVMKSFPLRLPRQALAIGAITRWHPARVESGVYTHAVQQAHQGAGRKAHHIQITAHHPGYGVELLILDGIGPCLVPGVSTGHVGSYLGIAVLSHEHPADAAAGDLFTARRIYEGQASDHPVLLAP